MTGVRFPTLEGIILPITASRQIPMLWVPKGFSLGGVKLTACFSVVPRLIMRGTVPPLPYTP